MLNLQENSETIISEVVNDQIESRKFATICNPLNDSAANVIKMKTFKYKFRQATAISNPVYDLVAGDIKMETIEHNLSQMESTDSSFNNTVVDNYQTQDLIECLEGNDSATCKANEPPSIECDNSANIVSPSVKLKLKTSSYENDVIILDVSKEKPIVIEDSSDELSALLHRIDDNSDEVDQETEKGNCVPCELNSQDKSSHSTRYGKRKHNVQNDLFNHKKQFTDFTSNVISNADFMPSHDHSFFWSSQLGPIDKQNNVPAYSALCSKSVSRSEELIIPSTKEVQIDPNEHTAAKPNREEANSSVPPEGALIVSLDVEKIQEHPVEQQLTSNRPTIVQSNEHVQEMLPKNITQCEEQPTSSNGLKNTNESNDTNAVVLVSSTDDTSHVQLLSNADKSNNANKTILLPLDYVHQYKKQQDLLIITLANRPFKFKFKVINENLNEMLYKTPGFESHFLNNDSAMHLLQLNKTHWNFVLVLMKQLGSFTYSSMQTTCNSLNILEKLLFFVFKSSQKMSINVGLLHTLSMDRACFVSNVYKHYRNIENELDAAVETLQNNLNYLYDKET